MRTTSRVTFTLAFAALGSACRPDLDDGSSDLELTAPTATTTAPTPTVPATAPTVVPTPPIPTGTTAPLPAPTTTPTVTPHDQLPPIFADAVRTAPAAPIAGGTLLVTADGTTAVAADPDRNSVFLVNLTDRGVRTVAAQPGDELGRVVEGPAGTVFVAARRGGAVLAINVAAGSVQSRYPVCNAPRGMAYDATQNRLYVACRSGRLATLDGTTGVAVSTLDLDADLRDVLLVDGALVVTRFRSAEILRLDSAGVISARGTPPDIAGNTPAVAFRGVALDNGLLLLSHQVESGTPLGTGLGAYYGGGCSGGGVVTQALSLVSVNGTALATPTSANGATLVTTAPGQAFSIASRVIVGAVGPVDLAVSRDHTRVAVVGSGNAWSVQGEKPTLFVDTLDVTSGGPPANFGGNFCNGTASVAHHAAGEPVAVAFDAAGHYLVQSREPALLELEGDIFVNLSDESHFDTGFAMFHLNTSGEISCASCHPEGGDDGHVWSFQALGLRRSQALEGGVSGRAPFHWSGDLPTFTDLFGEVMLKRMALPVVPPPEDVTALSAWLDTVPALAPADGLDPALVERGRTLFTDPSVACSACHLGTGYSDHLKHDVGTGGAFVTPALTGVGLRAPLMHDGCAATLRARFGICGGTDHGNIAHLSENDIDALVAFMRSL